MDRWIITRLRGNTIIIGTMGAGASVNILGELDSLSAEDVGKLVASIGPAYEDYKTILINEGISGKFLAELNDEEVASTLTDLGITKALHVKNICVELKFLKKKTEDGGGGNHTSGGVVSNVAGILEKVAKVVHDLDLPTRVSVTPRKLMTNLFAIQGIALDPSDLDPAIDKIAATVGSSGGVCDGDKSYDLFINYRVAADADVAEKLYLYLKTKGINAFLDKKCLKAGEPWKEGFLSGLSRSRMFLCLISSPALANVRDKTKNHEWDNVLLEYETALLIKGHLAEVDVDLARAYIVPVHVGQFSQGVLTKFTDFNSMMYPDSVGPESDHGGNASTAVMDLTTCEGTLAALQLPSLGPAEAEAALKVIGNLCRLDNEHAITLDNLGACKVVVQVLLTYSTANAFVAAQGCYAVHSLAHEGGREDTLIATGAVEALMKSLRSFPTNADVAYNGCWAIANLANGSNDRKDKFVAAGAIDEVIKVLQAFPANAEVAEKGCKALASFAVGGNDRKDKLVAAGAIDEVVKDLRAFPSHSELVRYGCRVIGSTAHGSSGRKTKVLAAGAKSLVETALKNKALAQNARDEAKDALSKLL